MAAGKWLRHVVMVGAALWLAWQIVFWTEPEFAFAVAERVAPGIVWRVATDKPLVALSFDDGPDPIYTPRVLAILERYGARATFFLIGHRARSQPALVKHIKAAGHELGNHYFTNGSTLRHDDADFIDYLQRAEVAIGLSGPRKLFRPPGGLAWPRQLRLARERGYTPVLGSAYPHDPARPPVWYIRWLVVKNLAPGTIVILHDGIRDPSRSIEALPQILAAGEQKGYRFVSIGTLMDASEDTLRQPRRTSARQ